MMKPLVAMHHRRVCLLATLFILTSASAYANVNKADPANGTTTLQFPAVGQFGDSARLNSSGTAILGGRHILVARHQVTVDGSIAGAIRPADEFRFKVDAVTYKGEAIYADFGADLAIVRLDGIAPYSAPLWSTAQGTELGQTFQAVGYGYVDDNADGHWGPGGLGTKRLFANTVDEIREGTLPDQGTVLRYDFDLITGEPVGELEGIAGPGDSGGGAFLYDGSQWRLTGLISSSGDPVDQAKGSLIRIADYQQTIALQVPEPTSMVFIGVVAGLLIPKRNTLLPYRHSRQV